MILSLCPGVRWHTPHNVRTYNILWENLHNLYSDLKKNPHCGWRTEVRFQTHTHEEALDCFRSLNCKDPWTFLSVMGFTPRAKYWRIAATPQEIWLERLGCVLSKFDRLQGRNEIYLNTFQVQRANDVANLSGIYIPGCRLSDTQDRNAWFAEPVEEDIQSTSPTEKGLLPFLTLESSPGIAKENEATINTIILTGKDPNPVNDSYWLQQDPREYEAALAHQRYEDQYCEPYEQTIERIRLRTLKGLQPLPSKPKSQTRPARNAFSTEEDRLILAGGDRGEQNEHRRWQTVEALIYKVTGNSDLTEESIRSRYRTLCKHRRAGTALHFKEMTDEEFDEAKDHMQD